VKDTAAFLKFAVNPNDEVAFKRMVRLLPGIGSKTAETLWNKTAELLGGGRSFAILEKGCKLPAKAVGGWSQLVATLVQLAPSGTPAPPFEMISVVTTGLYDDYMQAKFANYEARREDLSTWPTTPGNSSRPRSSSPNSPCWGNRDKRSPWRP